MGIHVLEDRESGQAVFFCSTSDWAFGPVMPSPEHARAFLKWLASDPRHFSDGELGLRWCDFCVLTDQQKHEAGLCETLGIEYDCELCKKERQAEEESWAREQHP